MAFLFDTCVLIDYLNGLPAAKTAFRLHTPHMISRINWLEVMCGVQQADQGDVRAFLETFEIVELDASIAEKAIGLRRTYRLKLPDLLIYAAALSKGAKLVTVNTKDFQAGMPDVIVPYEEPST